MRWLLGNLAHYTAEEAVGYRRMPELEQLILHRLQELDVLVREAYDAYDYKRIVAALSNFMNVEPERLLLRHPQGRALLRPAHRR